MPHAVKKIKEGNVMESSFHLGPRGPGFLEMSFEVRPEHCKAEVPCECLQGSIPSRMLTQEHTWHALGPERRPDVAAVEW